MTLSNDPRTNGQIEFGSERKFGEYATPAFSALFGLPIGLVGVLIFNGDWAHLNAVVWIVAIFALLGHVKSASNDEAAAQYRKWLSNYDREMLRVGAFDRRTSEDDET